MASQVRLRLLPSTRCLFDEPIQVKIAGLMARQEVTIKAMSSDQSHTVFSSAATYRADDSGEIDLTREPSLGGSYVGVEPMGLLWSMRSDPLHRRLYNNVLTPHVVNFSVHEKKDGKLLAEATNQRFLMGEGVTRVPVEEGNIRGVLFTPPGAGPFGAVLDLYTLGGRLTEKRAAVLASKGFVVLALELFSLKGPPSDTKKVDLDYFEEAIKFLRSQNKVGSKGVGLISLSKGGDLALSIASFLSGVDATVWINGCCANTAFPLYYKGQQVLAPLMFDVDKIRVSESGALIIKDCTHDTLAKENEATLIPIEKASGQFLFVAAEDDLNWDALAYTAQMAERLKRHGKNNFEILSYPGAGHYLEPPYGPFCPSSIHSLVNRPVLWGGEGRAHAAAEVHMWTKIKEFFRSCLGSETPPNNKL